MEIAVAELLVSILEHLWCQLAIAEVFLVLSGPLRGSVNYSMPFNKFLHEIVRVEVVVCNCKP